MLSIYSPLFFHPKTTFFFCFSIYYRKNSVVVFYLWCYSPYYITQNVIVLIGFMYYFHFHFINKRMTLQLNVSFFKGEKLLQGKKINSFIIYYKFFPFNFPQLKYCLDHFKKGKSNPPLVIVHHICL